MVSTSSGRIVRRSMTSASMPSSASASAACSARSTISEKATIVTSVALAQRSLARPIGSTKSSSLRHLEALAVEDLVLEEDDRVGIADRGLEQALGVGRRIGRDDLEPRAVAVPGAVLLAVLGARPGRRRRWARGTRSGSRARRPPCSSVLAAELMMWSIACMAKFQVMNSTIGLQPGKRRADAEPGEAVLGDRRVDHPAARRTPRAGPGSPCRRPGTRRPPRPSGRRRGRAASPRPSRRAAPRAPSA